MGKKPWEDPNWDPIFDEEDPLASSISNAVSGKITPDVDPIFDVSPYYDDFDEDDGDALASAGFGTDEDYGGDMI